MKKFIKKSFKRELLFSFLVVALVPFVLSSAFLIQMFKIKLASDYRKKDVEQAATIEHMLTGLFQSFDTVTQELCQDEKILTDMSTPGGWNRNVVYSALYEKTAGLRDQAQFDVYSKDGVCQYSTGTGMLHTQLPAYWGILKVASAHPEEMIIRREKEHLGDSDILLRAVRMIKDNEDGCAGFVVVSMREENFEEALRGTYSSQDGICIVDGFWETVYHTGIAAQENIGDILRGRLISGEGIPGSWNSNSLYISPLGDTGLYSIVLRPDVFTEDTTRAMYSVIIIMAAVSMALCAMVANRMSNSLTRPVKSLNLAMYEVQGGNLDTRIEVDRADEFGQLSDSFNTMTSELKDYMEKQVSQQKQINEIQVAMMQAQLNPHFLYNTLDTMKWVAKANHIPEIATLASKLAKILRTSISQVQFITLKEEMELVESYAEIQKIRFHGKFCFEYELPEEIKQCRIPKLIVQPIVENAVIHGLADCDEGHIYVKAMEKDGQLHIEVQDDGCGISREVMEHLNSRDREQLTGHLGFYNVDTIIRLHYGDEYGVQVETPESGGTKVTIVIPAEHGEE